MCVRIPAALPRRPRSRPTRPPRTAAISSRTTTCRACAASGRSLKSWRTPLNASDSHAPIVGLGRYVPPGLHGIFIRVEGTSVAGRGVARKRLESSRSRKKELLAGNEVHLERQEAEQQVAVGGAAAGMGGTL